MPKEYSPFYGDESLQGEKIIRSDAPDDEDGIRLADTHIHTIASDGRMTPEEVVLLAEHTGMYAIVTDHDTIAGAQDAREIYAKRFRGPNLIGVGSEVTAKGGRHILALGIEDPVPKGLSVQDTLDAIHKQGGLAIAAHPELKFGHSLSWETILSISGWDGVEVKNASAKRLSELPVVGEVIFSNKRNLDMYERHPGLGAATGGSDEHGIGIGSAVTGYRSNLSEAIRERKTIVLYDANDVRNRTEEARNLVRGIVQRRGRQAVEVGRQAAAVVVYSAAAVLQSGNRL